MNVDSEIRGTFKEGQRRKLPDMGDGGTGGNGELTYFVKIC